MLTNLARTGPDVTTLTTTIIVLVLAVIMLLGLELMTMARSHGQISLLRSPDPAVPLLAYLVCLLTVVAIMAITGKVG